MELIRDRVAATAPLATIPALLAALALLVGGCGDGDGAETAPTSPGDGTDTQEQVRIDIVSVTEGFEPTTMTVDTGAEVTWVNTDDVAHTTTAQDEGETWDSGTLAPGASFSFTPTDPGTYSYICTIHPSMVGELVVQ